MKKFLLVMVLLFTFAGSLFTTEYVHHCYSVKCAKCVEEAKEWPGHYVNVAFRTTEPYRKKDGKVYAQYHCMGGHYYWAELR